ncbi:MAG: cytochrome c biogenesis CcdA family protein [Pseudomonadota bacterium]
MGLEVSVLAAFLAGVISFLSPCVLPLVPPYLCFMAGTSIDQMTATDEGKGVQKKVMLAATTFVLGFSTVFILLGATASVLGQVLRQYLSLLGTLAGVAIIVMGLHFLGVFKLGILYREARFQTQSRPVGPGGSYLIGLAFGFGWTPCIGPVLAAILAVAASRDTVEQGILLLAIYSAGLGVPFLIAAFAIRPFMNFMKGMRQRMAMVEKAMGGMLVVTGVLFLTGTMNTFAFWLLETFPVLGTIG